MSLITTKTPGLCLLKCLAGGSVLSVERRISGESNAAGNDGGLFIMAVESIEQENAKLRQELEEWKVQYKSLEQEVLRLRRTIGALVTKVAYCNIDVQDIASAATWYPFSEDKEQE